jgi:hypothetical protein
MELSCIYHSISLLLFHAILGKSREEEECIVLGDIPSHMRLKSALNDLYRAQSSPLTVYKNTISHLWGFVSGHK